MIYLRKNLDDRVKKKPLMVNMEVQEVALIAARFNVFTQPLSVFTAEDTLSACAHYSQEENTVFVLISNSQFGLFYSARLETPQVVE